MGRMAGRRRFVGALLCASLLIGAFAGINPAEARHHQHGGARHYARHRTAGPIFRIRRAARAAAPEHYASNFSALVVDANSGRTLYSVNENDLRHPASISKVMTLYLLFEQLEKGKMRLDTEIPVSAHAASMQPTKLGLRAGSSITVENAIKAIVTQSANDMAVAVAEAIGGDEANFAHLMTEKAHALGMSRSHFANASGLPNPEQISTAHDLAILGRAIQERFPRYYAYFSTPSFTYAGRTMRNHNNLLGRVAGMDGIKTGFVSASGFNLLASVRRGGRHVVAVVLGGVTAGSRDHIMAGLIDRYFDEASDQRTAPAIAEATPNDSAVATDQAVVARTEPRVQPQTQVLAYAAPISDKPRPAFVSGTPKSVGEDHSSTGSIALEGSTRAHIITASAVARPSSTATPSTLHWVVGPPGQPLKAADDYAAPRAVAVSRIAKAEENAGGATRPEADRPAAAHNGVMIQIGATDDAAKANALLARALSENRSWLASAQAFTEKVQKGDATLYRARFAGLDADRAEAACKRLKRSGFACFTTKN
ncbi:MAG TPA: serine hydrolase [Beijerinckiaceae bacterium]|nr:serine hydrolase [Beijerinckiaceae bacterium]